MSFPFLFNLMPNELTFEREKNTEIMSLLFTQTAAIIGCWYYHSIESISNVQCDWLLNVVNKVSTRTVQNNFVKSFFV